MSPRGARGAAKSRPGKAAPETPPPLPSSALTTNQNEDQDNGRNAKGVRGSWRVPELPGVPQVKPGPPHTVGQRFIRASLGCPGTPQLSPSIPQHHAGQGPGGLSPGRPPPLPPPWVPPADQENPVLMPGGAYAAAGPHAQAADQTLSQPTRHRPGDARRRPLRERVLQATPVCSRAALSQADCSSRTSALEPL